MGVLSGTAGYLTLGCRVNQYETEAISEALEAIGFHPAPFGSLCDVYVINTCAVTEESFRKSRQMVRRAIKRNPNAFVAVCGCASQLEGAAFAAIPGVSFVCGSRRKDDVVAAIRDRFRRREGSAAAAISLPDGESDPNADPAVRPPKKESVTDADLAVRPSEKKNISGTVLAVRQPEKKSAPGAVLAVRPPEGNDTLRVTRFARARAYVKIEDGCDGKCAYCVIPTVRGGVTLRPEEEILSEIGALAAGGCREVVLTGIETAAYGSRLLPLVKRVAAVPGIERIRFGSLEPTLLRPAFVSGITAIPAVCPHFHLSVQNGSDRILRLMRRRYNAGAVEEGVALLRTARPDWEFSADVIVGFPGETETDFSETCEFVRRIGFLHLHIFPYSRRPGTEAAAMPDQIPEAVKAERLHRLEAIAAEERDKRLLRALSRREPLTILVETAEGRVLTGHSDAFFDCRVTAPADADPDRLRGRFLPFIPEKAENGVLYGSGIR